MPSPRTEQDFLVDDECRCDECRRAAWLQELDHRIVSTYDENLGLTAAVTETE